ncbi:3376_t:CDS:2, partial [Cetraspora pellucida]
TAKSGIIFLPPYDGAWMNCTNDITTIFNKSFSIKLVDYSTPVTPGFGDYVAGRSSDQRIRGIGFIVYSSFVDQVTSFSISALSNSDIYNMFGYCGTDEYPAIQCDSPIMGLSNPPSQKWCISITNPFNNSQKAH